LKYSYEIKLGRLHLIAIIARIWIIFRFLCSLVVFFFFLNSFSRH